MPDAPQPVSKKRKVNSEAASSLAPPPPEKKQRTNSGGASLVKSITTGTRLSTPSARSPVYLTSPTSASPRTKLYRSSVKQDAIAGPMTKLQLQTLRRQARASVTVSSKRQVDHPGIVDNTPPPVTALRRSSSGRIITSTPKLAAANDLGKPYGSSKTRLSRQKRKSLPVPLDIIELYSSEEDRRRGIKGKVPPVKKRKKRKAAEVIDLCSDDEPSSSPAKTPTMRARVHDNIVTILSSDDDKPSMRLDEPSFSWTPFSSQKKEKSRLKITLGHHKEDEPAVAAVSSLAARPLTQVDVYPKTLSYPPTHTLANDRRSESVIGDFGSFDARYNDTERGYENDLGSSLLGNVEGSVMRDSSTTPTPGYPHDDGEFHSPAPQSLAKHHVNHNSGHLTHPDYRNLLDTDTLPPDKPFSVPAPDVIHSTSESHTRVKFLERNITGNHEKGLENGKGVLPNRNTTPLFLPPLDDEEQDVEAQGPQYTLFWRGGEDSCNTSPSERNLITKLHTTAQPPSTVTRESVMRDGSPPALFLSSIQANEINMNEVGQVILSPSQHVPQPDNALTEIVPTISEGGPVVAMHRSAKDVDIHPLVERERGFEEKWEQVDEERSQMGLSGSFSRKFERNSTLPTKEAAHGESRDARPVELNTTSHPFGGTQNSGTKQLEGVHLAESITISPQLIRLSSPSESDINESVSLSSPTSYHQSLEKAYAEEVSRCRCQLLSWTPSYVNPNITYPSHPSTLLSHLRLHTPGFFSQSFILPPSVEERKAFAEDKQEQNNVVITQPTMINHFTSSEPTTVEVFIGSSRSVANVGTPTGNIPNSSIMAASPSPDSPSQAQEEAQVDALLLEQESYSESTPASLAPEGQDEVIAQVTTEFLENDPTLASALLESKMFMDILRDVQQEGSYGVTRIPDEPTLTPAEASDEHSSPPHDPTYFCKSVASPKNTQIGTPISEHTQYGHDQPLTSEQTTHLEHRSPPSPFSLISSSTLQDSPLLHTPKVEESAVKDADIFYICSESPSAFNPDAFAAILDMASPPPLAKEEDDYFSTHFFDYPDDVVA